MTIKIPIEVSARHIHLSQKDLDILFGKDYKMKVLHRISQPNQFATKETLTIINNKEKIENIRIIMPVREHSYAEISKTDAYRLKINPPVRISGDVDNCPCLIIKNKNNSIKIPVIIAKRHLHISNEQAKKLNLKDNQKISIRVNGERALVFEDIVVRVEEQADLSFQIDTDEANASGIEKKSVGELI